MRSASNPGGRGHEWVKRRFVDPETRIARTVYLPARLDDNPYIDAEDYVRSLQEMHPTHWRRLLHGDWSVANPGTMFQPRQWYADMPECMIDSAPALGVQARVRYWDFAASEPSTENPDPDWTCGARMSRLTGSKGIFVIEHVLRMRRTTGTIERVVHDTALADPKRTRFWMEQEPGALAKQSVYHYHHDVMPLGMPMRGNHVSKSKAERARPLAGAMEQGRVHVVRGEWTETLFDEMEAFSEDAAHSGAHDDQVDACSGAFDRVRRMVTGAGIVSEPAGAVQR
jgi:predicted phage terminase large subunit-like protein